MEEGGGPEDSRKGQQARLLPLHARGAASLQVCGLPPTPLARHTPSNVTHVCTICNPTQPGQRTKYVPGSGVRALHLSPKDTLASSASLP